MFIGFFTDVVGQAVLWLLWALFVRLPELVADGIQMLWQWGRERLNANR